MKKILTCSSFTGSLFYGTVNEEKGIYTNKELIDGEQFKVAMLNYIMYHLNDNSSKLELEVQNRKFIINIKEVENESKL